VQKLRSTQKHLRAAASRFVDPLHAPRRFLQHESDSELRLTGPSSATLTVSWLAPSSPQPIAARQRVDWAILDDYSSALDQSTLVSSSGSKTTLSCSFGSVLAITAITGSVRLRLYGRCGTLAAM